MTGAGEPPTPGVSKRMTVRRGSSALTNGSNSSRLTPMPLHSSSGGQLDVPSRTDTRMARPPAFTILIRSAGLARRSRLRTARARPAPGRSFPAAPGWDVSMVIDICSRGVADRHQPGTAGLVRGRLLVTAALGEPARIVRPPGAVTGLRAPEPFLGIFRGLLRHLESRLLVSRRVDHRGDVPAGGQHEPVAAGQQLGRPVAALPGAGVVGGAGHGVGV